MYPQQHLESPFAVWRRFAIWSVLALVGMLAVGGFGKFSGLIVLGWAFGMVVAAAIMLIRQR